MIFRLPVTCMYDWGSKKFGQTVFWQAIVNVNVNPCNVSPVTTSAR